MASFGQHLGQIGLFYANIWSHQSEGLDLEYVAKVTTRIVKNLGKITRAFTRIELKGTLLRLC